jgi:hypothetical protein
MMFGVPQVGQWWDGRHLEDHPHAVHGQLLAGGRDGHGRVDERDGAGRGGLAQPGSHPAFRPAGQRGTVHVPRPAGHRRPGVDVLRDRVLDEAFGGDDLDRARVDIVLGHNPLHAAEMIDVAVGVDHRGNRPVTAVLAVQRQRRRRRLGRDQRVDDDDPGVALDDAHVGQVVAADLVDPAGHLEQALPGLQGGLSPQARMHRLRRVPGQEAVRPVVPDHLARLIADNRIPGIDKPAPGSLEVSGVPERQPFAVSHSRPSHPSHSLALPRSTRCNSRLRQHSEYPARRAHPRRMIGNASCAVPPAVVGGVQAPSRMGGSGL